MASQGSQAGAHLPSGEGSNLAASQATQAGSSSPSLRGRKQLSDNNSGSPPIPCDSASFQAGSEATTNTPAEESPSQAGNNLPSSQAGSQL